MRDKKFKVLHRVTIEIEQKQILLSMNVQRGRRKTYFTGILSRIEGRDDVIEKELR